MKFYMPTLVYEELNCVANHAAEICALGTKAMIVTGRSSAKLNGSQNDVAAVLDAGKIPYIVFDEVEENPSVETVMKAREIGIAEGVDLVIGIGGGSPLDAGKAIALMIKHADKDASYLYQAGADSSAIPFVAIPTTCGTGSEATAYSVLTRHDLGTKVTATHVLFPVISLIDGKYLAYAPQKVLCNTATDAFGHMIESYISTRATDYSMMLCEKALEIWARTKDVLTGEKKGTAEDYLNLLNASTIAGMAIAQAGTSLPHGLSYIPTTRYGILHGPAIGYFQKGYIKYAEKDIRDKAMKLAGFADIDEMDAFYMQICNNPTIPEEFLLASVDGMMSNEAKLKNAPYKVDRAVLKDICRL